ncbi:MAG TPA: VCBS repeat-containing protein [Vicinamibacterales bacterium]|nr:VCBS repeat-containing protein [Vicinamibacterales bacterium]
MRTSSLAATVATVSLLTCATTVRAAVIQVPDSASLQPALNSAQPGDTILLQPGVTYTGTFVLPDPGGTSYVTLSTAPGNLPAGGVRISPANAPQLAKLRSPPNGSPALSTAPGAHHWRVMLLEFQANSGGGGDIITLGDGSASQNSLSGVAHDLVFDRVYIHGDPMNGAKRGIALNSASTTITESYISDIKEPGIDSQAICGWNGPGPYTITNNYLEAAGENLMFGGADPFIQGLVPADITITDNHIAKPIAWHTQPPIWSVKNLLELKNARRVEIARNLLEYNWQASQNGFSILFTVRNQDGGCPWCQVDHVTFEQNTVQHVAAGINILGLDDIHQSQQTQAIIIRNNLFADIDPGNWGGNGYFLQLLNGARDITVDHNTVIQEPAPGFLLGIVFVSGPPVTGFVFTNNLTRHNSYGIIGDNHGPGNDTINAYFSAPRILSNVIADGDPARYPAGNLFPASAYFRAQFVSYAGGDYRLRSDSPWKNAGTDGLDLGMATATGVIVSRGNLLWRNSQTGDVEMWLMNGVAVAQEPIVSSGVPLAWQIAGVGDVDGDGKADLVWRQIQTGDVAVWLMDGATVKQAPVVALGVPLAWQIVGVADLDGDGKADLVWRNSQNGDVAVWLMNGAAVKGIPLVASGVPLAWQIVGVGDVDGDGKADLVWRNSQTGDVAVWLMNGAVAKGIPLVASGVPLAWQIAGVADVDGDGKADLVWRQTQTGDVAVWLMDGATVKQSPVIATAVPLSWQIATLRDLDGDGKADVIWRNTTSGDVAVWLMNGTAVRQNPVVASGVPLTWQIQR